MSSLVGPLVKPNTFENRFDRTSLRNRVFRHPLLDVFAILLALAGVAAVKLGYVQLPL
jgi:hypothetical protein